MFNSVCGEQQPHPARHEAGMEKTRAPKHPETPRARDPQENHRRDNRGLHPEKGRRRARRRDLRQPQCRRPRVPWRQARRLHRQPTIPGRTGPWARRPKGPPPHNRGPARPVGPGPPIDRREWAGARPSILPRREKSPTHRRHPPPAGHGGGWGSTKMMSEAESKARPDT